MKVFVRLQATGYDACHDFTAAFFPDLPVPGRAGRLAGFTLVAQTGLPDLFQHRGIRQSY